MSEVGWQGKAVEGGRAATERLPIYPWNADGTREYVGMYGNRKRKVPSLGTKPPATFPDRRGTLSVLLSSRVHIVDMPASKRARFIQESLSSRIHLMVGAGGITPLTGKGAVSRVCAGVVHDRTHRYRRSQQRDWRREVVCNNSNKEEMHT